MKTAWAMRILLLEPPIIPKTEDDAARVGYRVPKKRALEVFGLASSDTGTTQPSTTELPSLSGNFVEAFVGRRLTGGSS